MTIKKLDSVDLILEFLEENIDEKHCAEAEQRHLDALHFKRNTILPLSIYCKPEGELLSNVEAFNNPEVMLHNELLKSETFGNVVNSVKTKDDYPLHIRSNHGLATTLSMIGGVFKLNEGAPPWAVPYEDGIKAYRRKWEDKLYNIAGDEVVQKVRNTYEYMKERLNNFPKCSRCIRLSHPDMQGPLAIAQNLIGEDLFYEFYDNPDDVHWLLNRITGAYIEFYRMIDPLMNNYTGDKKAVYIHGAIYPGQVLLKNDTAIAMLSEEHYLEFCKQYDEKVKDALGDVSIHYCGASRSFHGKILMMPGLKGLNFGDPQMQDFDQFMEQWNTQGIAAVCWGYHQPPKFLVKTLKDRNITGFTLCCTVDDIGKAAEYVKRYRGQGLIGLDGTG